MISKLMDWLLGGSPWPLVICIAVAGIGGGLAGAQVATWRADANNAKVVLDMQNQIATLTDEKNQLTLAVEKQNSALDVAKAQSDAAQAAQVQAQQHAADLAQFSQSRLDKLQQAFASATNCDAVLRRYWELRR